MFSIQNQIIEACNKLILNKIVDKINKSQCFSILADETTDVSNIEQLSLCVRYVNNNNMLNEDFIQFIAIHSLTGLDLATSILKGLSDCGVNSEYIYGQGYDRASNMAGQFKSVQKIRDKYPNALYVHCSAHSLNLAVSSSSNIKPIRNSLNFISIEWKDSSSTDANMFLKCIQDSEFLVSLYVTKERIDLKKTVDIVENLIQSLMNIREDAQHEFKRIVDEAQTMAELIGTSISRKRITSKKTNRANPQNLKSTKDYYRVTVFLPYIDNFISQLKDRFVNHKNVLRGFECLFHSEFSNEDRNEFQHLIELYSPAIDRHNVLAELKMWKLKLASSSNEITKTGIEAFLNCDKDIKLLLKIFVTLPVSTATPERSFSSLKRLKTHLRNTMNETRLNGLSLLSVHRNIDLSAEEVIDELSKTSRKLDFVL
ncbi:zinc finger MYM-type protein 1-like [Acyrthosiphon pisum]|uniref:Uncharacterized protein n=1 Tax=Acyrthosiphon pisum TaxID=7029 RepID=A0A8R1X0I5_ACYPI|nr:zinc finger MYM-type protein 1-like [Acyrthosiphon pisum]|eukprot:XP_008178694.1 PREDICTED: zinc finger MYM-type protein 1-like [Acyrthosiphon pisum]